MEILGDSGVGTVLKEILYDSLPKSDCEEGRDDSRLHNENIHVIEESFFVGQVYIPAYIASAGMGGASPVERSQ